jgi:hypothetical protein
MVVNADCFIVLPLGVRINACGKTLDQIGEEICAAFKPDGPTKALVRRVK